MYRLLRAALFALSPETSHDISLESLKALQHLGLLHLLPEPRQQKPKNLWGIEFPNALGLAAGLDKNADYLDALGQLGFGFIEVGTVTPKPQPGNPQPRLFRLTQSQAIINRMGFNNKGVDYLVGQVQKARYPGVIGINIGKNKETPDTEALNDYLYCLDRVYPHAHYVVVNLSSPNTPGLRSLQFGEALKHLLAGLKERQSELASHWGRRPILLKIAPDVDETQVAQMCETFNDYEVDGVIATNTTLDRSRVLGEVDADQAGGLSGLPLFDSSTQVLKWFRHSLHHSIPLVGVGGVSYGRDAVTKVAAGAELVQLYSGFIYKGPALIRECIEALASIEH